MFNAGDLKGYLKDGKRREDMIGVPRVQGDALDDGSNKLAKTFLKVTLSEHDKRFHSGGYHEGDTCNFREALKRGDSADALVSAEKKEAGIKVGFIRFKEDEKTGEKKIVGIEEVKKVDVDGSDGSTVKVAGLEVNCKAATAEDSADAIRERAIRRYLGSVGK